MSQPKAVTICAGGPNTPAMMLAARLAERGIVVPIADLETVVALSAVQPTDAEVEMQEEWHNPLRMVAFRAGFILCREYIARFVEQGGDKPTAASIRLNWIPALGDDPGGPRKLDFAECVSAENMDEGPWDAKNPGVCAEAAVYALAAMAEFGMTLPDEAALEEVEAAAE